METFSPLLLHSHAKLIASEAESYTLAALSIGLLKPNPLCPKFASDQAAKIKS